jgi:2-keto-4-pentenoate hydratase/2-oxohepta-3-ene-1,7-dioic acid hydratase in catechol pathway
LAAIFFSINVNAAWPISCQLERINLIVEMQKTNFREFTDKIQGLQQITSIIFLETGDVVLKGTKAYSGKKCEIKVQFQTDGKPVKGCQISKIKNLESNCGQ